MCDGRLTAFSLSNVAGSYEEVADDIWYKYLESPSGTNLGRGSNGSL